MSKELRIGAVGDNCMDVYEKEGKYYPGGNPVNVAVYTVRLGGTASYVGVTGTDKYGPLMIESIKNKGVDVSHLRVAEGETAKSYVELVDNDRVFGDYVEGVMEDFRMTDEDIEFLGQFDMVVSAIFGRTSDEIHKLKEKGMTVAFDFADKREDDPRVMEAIDHVDYAFFSYDDDDVEDFILKMWRPTMKVFIATQGEKGSVAYDGQKFYHYGIVKVDNVVDTMGAGDSYIAGFLFRIMRGGTIEESMAEGAACSAVTIQYSAAW